MKSFEKFLKNLCFLGRISGKYFYGYNSVSVLYNDMAEKGNGGADMAALKIVLLFAACTAFFVFEHNAPHHQPITKDSPQEDKDELEKTGWMRE